MNSQLQKIKIAEKLCRARLTAFFVKIFTYATYDFLRISRSKK